MTWLDVKMYLQDSVVWIKIYIFKFGVIFPLLGKFKSR